MNKKTVIFGSIFTIFILVMMPNLGALEYTTVVNENESKLIREIEEMRPMELIRYVKQINTEELKDLIITEIEKLNISEEQKNSIFNLIDSDIFLDVLIRGIILPILIMVISSSGLFNINFRFSATLGGFIAGWLFLIPVSEMIEEELGINRFLAYFALAIIDILLSNVIINILGEIKNE